MKKAISRGILVGFIVTVVLAGLGLTIALLKGRSPVFLSPYLETVACGSLLAGGFVSGYTHGSKGWLCGGAVGLIICTGSLLASLLILPRSIAPVEMLLAVLPATVLTAMAGFCGVTVARAGKSLAGRHRQRSPKAATAKR